MDANIVMTQFGASAAFVLIMQKLKSSSWFPLWQEKGTLLAKRATSIIYAIFVHTGISHIWNPGITPGYHRLIIDIPPLTIILVELWHWVCQYAMQECLYQGVANKPKT